MTSQPLTRTICRGILTVVVGSGLLFGATPQATQAGWIGPVTLVSLDSAYRPTSILRTSFDQTAIAIPNLNAVAIVEGSSSTAAYPLTSPSARPFDLVIGPDQAMWVSEQNTNRIARIENGLVQEYALESTPGAPAQMAAGQDGRLWYTDFSNNRVGWIKPDGEQGSTLLPTANSRPLGLAVDVDGNIWFTEWDRAVLGRIDAAGTLEEYTLPATLSHPAELVLASDGYLWFTNENSKRIGRFDPETHQSEVFTLATASSAFSDLTPGPDGRMYFIGFQTVGSFDASSGTPQDVREYPHTQPVFEAEGRTQLTVGPDEDILFITASGANVFSLETDSAVQRDLQLFNTDAYPTTFLAGGELELQYIVRNWSNLPTQDALLTIDLPNGVTLLEAEGISAPCDLNTQQLSCPLGTLSAQSDLEVRLTFTAEREVTLDTPYAFTAELSSVESDYAPANNRVVQNFRWKKLVEYVNDFSQSTNPGWSADHRVDPSNSDPRLGAFANTQVNFNWNALPMHDSVTLCYDLYITGSWDGSQITDPNDPGTVIGPDIWTNYLNDQQIIATTFSNQSNLVQSYPFDYLAGTSAAGSWATRGDFDGGGQADDTQYRICRIVPHTETDLQVVFYAAGLDEDAQETWGVDNVHIRAYYYTALDYLYIPYLTQTPKGE